MTLENFMTEKSEESLLQIDQQFNKAFNIKNQISKTEKRVYLDYNATTPLENEVAMEISKSLRENWQNPSSQNQTGKMAKDLINESRRKIGNMINSQASDIVFTSGGTESNNMVFHSCLQYYKKYARYAAEKNVFITDKPHLIISNIEHDSVKCIADYYKKEDLAQITEIEINEDGSFNETAVINAIKPNTILISIMLANNETGVILAVRNLSLQLKKLELICTKKLKSDRYCPLFLHTDAAQAIGKVEVDVEDLNVDYLTIVGHKFYGPRIGALYIRNCMQFNEHLRKTPLSHLFFGANQENGLRPGTENTPMIIGLGKAAELVTNNLIKYSNHMRTIRDYLEKRLTEEFGKKNIRFNGRLLESQRLPNTSNVSFISDENFKGHLILGKSKKFEASTGACCHSGNFSASKILLAMKIDKNVASNALRISVGRETSMFDIEIVIDDLKRTLENIKKDRSMLNLVN